MVNLMRGKTLVAPIYFPTKLSTDFVNIMI